MEQEKIVYRVQTASNDGPYACPVCLPDGLTAPGGNDPRQPGPLSDGVSWDAYYASAIFGFTTPKQLLSWFGDKPVIEWLEANNFHVAKYSVPTDALWEGKHQVAFRLNRAKLLASRAIKSGQLPFTRKKSESN